MDADVAPITRFGACREGFVAACACAAITVFALAILLALVAARPMRVVRLLFGAEPNHIAQHVLSGRRV